MKIAGANTVLAREMDFLGLTKKELFIMIQRNPYAFSNRTIEAYKVAVQEEKANG